MKNGEPIPVNQFSNLVTQSLESSNFIDALNLIINS